MKCPACKETTLTISERKGIEIDFCPECRGIWLDRGELDKILERTREEESRETPQPQQQPHIQPQAQQHQPYYPNYPYGKPYKRKKSFLEELFD